VDPGRAGRGGGQGEIRGRASLARAGSSVAKGASRAAGRQDGALAMMEPGRGARRRWTGRAAAGAGGLAACSPAPRRRGAGHFGGEGRAPSRVARAKPVVLLRIAPASSSALADPGPTRPARRGGAGEPAGEGLAEALGARRRVRILPMTPARTSRARRRGPGLAVPSVTTPVSRPPPTASPTRPWPRPTSIGPRGGGCTRGSRTPR
jgi:hypothetical protein